jgi:DNA-binding transcriptional regulator LsrR (DeoR family)
MVGRRAVRIARLRYGFGLTIREIAARTGIRRSLVKRDLREISRIAGRVGQDDVAALAARN